MTFPTKFLRNAEVPRSFSHSKILFGTPFEPLFEKNAKSGIKKKSSNQKKVFSKSCSKFCKLGDEFVFILMKSQK